MPSGMNHQVTRAASHESGQPGDTEGDKRGDLDLAHRGQLAPDEADRADAVPRRSPVPRRRSR